MPGGLLRPDEASSFLKFLKTLPKAQNIERPNADDLKRLSACYGNLTEFGNYNFCSTVRNRSAPLTVYIGGDEVRQKKLSKRQEEIIREAPATLVKVQQYLEKAPLYYIRLTMGENDYFTPHCNLYVSHYRTDYVRLAHMIYQTLFPDTDTPGPELYLVDLPEWQEHERQVLVFPEDNLTLVLGSDYYGEIKKGFLRMGMYASKRYDMLGLHAGSKLIQATMPNGKLRKLGMILFGLTATGKTTHACHDHGLHFVNECVRIVQDDVVFLKKDGSALGTERGFYIKTDGLNPTSQPLLYKAATSTDAILENITVNYRGKVDFSDDILTSNGRGIIQRDDLGSYRNDSLNLPSLDHIDTLIVAFITRRNNVLPIASKLSIGQAAGAFMLGESVESSGGDPKKAGESVRVVGTNPFIVGSEAAEGNWFYDFLRLNSKRVECYLLNTGGVGEVIEQDEEGRKRVNRKVTRVEILEMASIIRGICRKTIDWVPEPYFHTLVPASVDGVDMSRFDLARFYTDAQIAQLVKSLKKERRQYLAQFNGLNPSIAREYGN